MSFLGLGGSTPAVPESTPPTSIADVTKAGADTTAAKAGAGIASTIATGGQGLTTTASTAVKTLLGS